MSEVEMQNPSNYNYNPYDFINPIKDPKYFAGRHKELEEIDYYLELSQSDTPRYFHLALIGPRASGKTSLLNIIEHIAKDKGFLPVKIPLNKETSQNDVLFFKEIFDGIMTKGAERGMYGGIGGKVYKSFRKIIDALETKMEIPLLFGTAYIGLKKNQQEVGITQQVLIHDLKELYKEAKKNNIPTIVLLLDECDLLAQNEVILQKIRNALMEVEGYILVFSGTEKMFSSIQTVFSPMPRFFKRIDIGNFKDIKETEECILKPLNEEERKLVDPVSIVEIHQITGGSPYEINLIAHYMYRRYKDGKSQKIELSTEVLDDVLNEVERLRKEGHHEIADKIKGYRYQIDNLRVLISLLEFPNVAEEWLIEYALLNELDTLQPTDIHLRKSIIKENITQLKADRVILEKNGKIQFRGDYFDVLYLKYFAISKGIKDFFIGSPDEPLGNLIIKLVDNILLKDFREYRVQTRLDTKEIVEGRMGRKIIFGVKKVPSSGRVVVGCILEQLNKEFYSDPPNSIRFRINVKWMKEGFATQVVFEEEDDREKLHNRLIVLKNKLEFLGIEILLKDEISWANEGIELLRQRKLSEAIDCFDKAIKIHPLFELPWAYKSIALFDLKEYDKALECINKTIELRPDWADAWREKGKILINLKKNEEALECLEKAVNLNPEDWSIWDNKGRALFNLKRYKEAVDCFNKSLKLNPTEEVFCLKGKSLIKLERFNEAIESFDEVLRRNPNNVEAWILKGLSFYELRSYREAVECCDKALEIDRNNALAWYCKACCEIKIGNIESTLECLKKSIEIDRSYIEKAKKEEDFTALKNDPRFISLIWKKQ